MCNSEAAHCHTQTRCTHPWFDPGEEAHLETHTWTQTDGSHELTAAGLATLLVTMCRDWSLWKQGEEQQTQTEGISGHLPSTGTREESRDGAAVQTLVNHCLLGTPNFISKRIQGENIRFLPH